jgi:hypothetical protein
VLLLLAALLQLDVCISLAAPLNQESGLSLNIYQTPNTLRDVAAVRLSIEVSMNISQRVLEKKGFIAETCVRALG